MGPDLIKYKVSYRNVKYPRLEFKTGELLLVLPYGQDPKVFLEKHRHWIVKKNKFIRECLNLSSDKEVVKRTDEEFKGLVLPLVEKICKELDLRINKVYFRQMRTKWASCSPRRNLTINKLMRYLPEYLIEYIVFHEITHIIERRHNKRFWGIVAKRFNNYRELEQDLFRYWFLIQLSACRPIPFGIK